MKTFIVGLFSLAVLASGAAWGHKDPEGKPYEENLPAVQGFCKANDGIFVIIVKNDGKAYFRKCKEVKGQGGGPAKTITKSDKHPDPGGYSETLPSYTLGVIQKSRPPGDPDPCINWTVGGNRYYYCW